MRSVAGSPVRVPHHHITDSRVSGYVDGLLTDCACAVLPYGDEVYVFSG